MAWDSATYERCAGMNSPDQKCKARGRHISHKKSWGKWYGMLSHKDPKDQSYGPNKHRPPKEKKGWFR
jgi:hypothetical protein